MLLTIIGIIFGLIFLLGLLSLILSPLLRRRDVDQESGYIGYSHIHDPERWD
jgi:hypothetical protein